MGWVFYTLESCYKAKKQLDFVGSFISLKEVKDQIMEREKISKSFSLSVTPLRPSLLNIDGTDDCLVPSQAHLLVRRTGIVRYAYAQYKTMQEEVIFSDIAISIKKLKKLIMEKEKISTTDHYLIFAKDSEVIWGPCGEIGSGTALEISTMSAKDPAPAYWRIIVDARGYDGIWDLLDELENNLLRPLHPIYTKMTKREIILHIDNKFTVDLIESYAENLINLQVEPVLTTSLKKKKKKKLAVQTEDHLLASVTEKKKKKLEPKLKLWRPWIEEEMEETEVTKTLDDMP